MWWENECLEKIPSRDDEEEDGGRGRPYKNGAEVQRAKVGGSGSAIILIGQEHILPFCPG